MGTRGTMVVSSESELMLYKEQEPGKPAKPRETKVTVDQVGQQAGPGGGQHLGRAGGGRAPAGGGGTGDGRRARSAAGTRRRWPTSPTASASGTRKAGYRKNRQDAKKDSTSSGCRGATAKWPWPTRSWP